VKVEIKVYQEGDHYCAEMCGGWWSAIGKTEKDAIKKVKDRFMKEQEYFGIIEEPALSTLHY